MALISYPRSAVSIAVYTVKTAIVFAAAFLFSGAVAWWLVSPLMKEVTQQQIFTMQGEATTFADPDTALILVGNELTGSNPADLQRRAEQAVAKTRDQLVAAGINGDDIRTSQYNLSPQYETVSGQRNLKQYVMTIELEVRTQKLDLVGKVIDLAVANDLNRIGGVRFIVQDQTKINEQLRKEAVANAEKQAKELAQNSGLRLGKVINVIEGAYYGPVPGYADGKSVSATPDRATTSPGTTVSPGKTELKMTVTVYYEVR